MSIESTPSEMQEKDTGRTLEDLQGVERVAQMIDALMEQAVELSEEGCKYYLAEHMKNVAIQLNEITDEQFAEIKATYGL